MAIFQSQVLTAASGSIGGQTYSHNKGGMYIRSRAVPTNPNSLSQQAVRASLAAIANLWNNSLSPAQRTAWNAYAAQVTVANALGSAIQLSGINHFIRSNAQRTAAAVLFQNTAPSIFNLGDFTNPTAVLGAPTTLAITFEATDDWVGEDEAFMQVRISPPRNPSISYHRTPMRIAGYILGNSGAPPAPPQNLVSPFTYALGQRCWIATRVARADGRLSDEQWFGPFLAT